MLGAGGALHLHLGQLDAAGRDRQGSGGDGAIPRGGDGVAHAVAKGDQRRLLLHRDILPGGW